MRMYPREFPPTRRGKPKRRAEQLVYEALANINRRGFVYYEWRKGYERIELDFAAWIEGLGRFALQVKGGRYRLSDGDWHLASRDGPQPVRSCPLDEAKLAALDLHDDIEERACTPYNTYVIPALAFPDMEPDAAIERLARRKGVYVIWGVENLLSDLERIVRGRSVADALPMERIAREVRAVTDGLIRLEGVGRVERPDPHPEDGPFSTVTISVNDRVVLRITAGAKTMSWRSAPTTGPPPANSGSVSPRWPPQRAIRATPPGCVSPPSTPCADRCCASSRSGRACAPASASSTSRISVISCPAISKRSSTPISSTWSNAAGAGGSPAWWCAASGSSPSASATNSSTPRTRVVRRPLPRRPGPVRDALPVPAAPGEPGRFRAPAGLGPRPARR